MCVDVGMNCGRGENVQGAGNVQGAEMCKELKCAASRKPTDVGGVAGNTHVEDVDSVAGNTVEM